MLIQPSIRWGGAGKEGGTYNTKVCFGLATMVTLCRPISDEGIRNDLPPYAYYGEASRVALIPGSAHYGKTIWHQGVLLANIDISMR